MFLPVSFQIITFILLSIFLCCFFPCRYEWEEYFECYEPTYTRELCRDHSRLRGHHITLLLPLLLTTLRHRGPHTQRPPPLTRHATQSPSEQQQQCFGSLQNYQLPAPLPRSESWTRGQPWSSPSFFTRVIHDKGLIKQYCLIRIRMLSHKYFGVISGVITDILYLL